MSLQAISLSKEGSFWFVLLEDEKTGNGWWGRDRDPYEARAMALRMARRDMEMKIHPEYKDGGSPFKFVDLSSVSMIDD